MGSGVDKRCLHSSVYQVLLQLATLEGARIASPSGHFDVLPANRDLAGAEVELVDLDQREMRLKAALAAHRADYDFVLIDCPPSLSMLTLNGLCAAHGVIIPMQCEYYALEGLSDLVNTIKKVHANLRPWCRATCASPRRPATVFPACCSTRRPRVRRPIWPSPSNSSHASTPGRKTRESTETKRPRQRP